MLGGCCPDRRSSRLLSPAEVANRLHIDEPETASGRPSYARARVGPPHPATGASKPSWPSPSKQSSCILSPEPLWPLAEHIGFGQNRFDVSSGSGVLFCISTSCQGPSLFSILSLHRIVGFYRSLFR